MDGRVRLPLALAVGVKPNEAFYTAPFHRLVNQTTILYTQKLKFGLIKFVLVIVKYLYNLESRLWDGIKQTLFKHPFLKKCNPIQSSTQSTNFGIHVKYHQF